MYKFEILEKEREFEKATRNCQVCSKDYDVFVFFGDETFTSCFECVKCHNLLWYDYYVDKYFDQLDKDIRDSRQVWARIESELPLCKCGGNYKRSDWVTCGAPEHCIHCHVSQKTNGTPLKRNMVQKTLRKIKEKVAFIVGNEIKIGI